MVDDQYVTVERARVYSTTQVWDAEDETYYTLTWQEVAARQAEELAKMRNHPKTDRELQDLLPNSAIETQNNGELVIYTGWAVDPDDPDGTLVDWCEECGSGADLEPGYTCANCQRSKPKPEPAMAGAQSDDPEGDDS